VFSFQKKYSVFLLMLTCICGVSQNVTVEGKADPSYIGKVITLYTETDLITHIEHKETEDTIQKDGYFELQFHTSGVQLVKIRIDQAIAKLYVEPDYVYGITLPEVDPTFKYDNGSELELNIGLMSNDSTELNALIMDYQTVYNNFFIGTEQRFLSRPMMFKRADSLQKYCDQRYKNITNQYFKSHVLYSIASVNASVSRGENYLINGYILHKPILYNNKAYMDFFETCFKGYLSVASTAKSSQSLQYLVNNSGDYQRLNAYFKDDKFLKKDSIRELVILQNLWTFYFNPDYNTESIKRLVSQIHSFTKIEEHKRICSTMLSFMNKMLPGSEAPVFIAKSSSGKPVTLNSFKGKWIYLNFFSTSNTESLREMPKILALKKKFGDKVVFLSVCLDDSLKTYKDYLTANPRFNWPIWFNNGVLSGKSAREAYSVTGTEAYFLISNQFYLVQSPALSPSQGIEYRFNMLFKPKRKNTKTGIR
jgi:hypothetical protein